MKSNFPIVELRTYIRQVSLRNHSEKDISVFSVTNSEGFTKSTDYFNKEVFSKDLSNYKVVTPGQFAYNPSRINVGSIDCLSNHNSVLVSPLYIVFEVESTIHTNYLLRYLKSDWGISQIRANTEGAVRDSLKFKGLESIKIPLPSLNCQIRIAHLLGKVEGLIAQRKRHLQQLDDLLKSVFLDMFGDPVTNEKMWTKTLLQHLCHSPKDIKCGPFGTQLSKSEFQKNGIPVWGIPQINSEFEIPPNDFVTKNKASELDEYSVMHNDIVMSRKGAVGKCSLYPPSMSPGIMHSDVLRIRADWSKTNPHYLCWQLRLSRDVERQIANVSSGAIMAGINVGKLKSINVLSPPISLQNQFANLVEKIETLKIIYKKSLINLEALYGSLSQKAFNGELDLSQVPLPQVEPNKTPFTAPIEIAPTTSLPKEIELPNTKLLRKELSNPRQTNDFFHFWLDSYCTQLGHAKFTAQEFMVAAQKRLNDELQAIMDDKSISTKQKDKLAELYPNNEYVLTVKDYDLIKEWMFKALADRRALQSLKITEDSPETGKPINVNRIEVKYGVGR